MIASIGILFVVKGRLPKQELKINKLEEWVGVGTRTAIVFVIGQTLLTLSTFPSVTRSTCLDPSNVTITSQLCKMIQTTETLPNATFGNLGTLLLQVAVIWTLLLVGLVGLFYVLYVLPKVQRKMSWYVPEQVAQESMENEHSHRSLSLFETAIDSVTTTHYASSAKLGLLAGRYAARELRKSMMSPKILQRAIPLTELCQDRFRAWQNSLRPS